MNNISSRLTKLEAAAGMSPSGPSRFVPVYWNSDGTSEPGGDDLKVLLEDSDVKIVNIRFIGGLK